MAGEVYDARKEFPMEHGLMEDCGERFHLVKVQNYGMKQLIPVDTVPVTPHETLFAKERWFLILDRTSWDMFPLNLMNRKERS